MSETAPPPYIDSHKAVRAVAIEFHGAIERVVLPAGAEVFAASARDNFVELYALIDLRSQTTERRAFFLLRYQGNLPASYKRHTATFQAQGETYHVFEVEG